MFRCLCMQTMCIQTLGRNKTTAFANIHAKIVAVVVGRTLKHPFLQQSNRFGHATCNIFEKKHLSRHEAAYFHRSNKVLLFLNPPRCKHNSQYQLTANQCQLGSGHTPRAEGVHPVPYVCTIRRNHTIHEFPIEKHTRGTIIHPKGG